jgi:hypothetical protein
VGRCVPGSVRKGIYQMQFQRSIVLALAALASVALMAAGSASAASISGHTNFV